MRIGDLSRCTGVSARSLRHYEEAGLIRPVRLESGYRDYDESQVITVGLIKTLIGAGLPVTLIAEVLPSVPAVGGYNQPTDALAARLEQICEQLREQRESMSRAILILGGVMARLKSAELE